MATLEAAQSLSGRSTAAQLKLDPLWDPLRQDPRFQKLLADTSAALAQGRP